MTNEFFAERNGGWMSRIELSKRLQRVADSVTEGSRLADVGTDHGYIPIYLVEQGTCPAAVAGDVNKGPLERAAAHVQAAGLEDRISLRLGSGLKAVDVSEVDSVVMAGMGGELICQILRDSPEFMEAGREFILQPQSEIFKVRRLLHENGYRIEGEWNLLEDGKYYVIIKALPGRESYAHTGDYEYGKILIEEKDPLLADYLRKQLMKKKAIVERLSETDHGDRIQELREEIQEIQRILDKMEGRSGK